jgi:glycine hydroxymethyltransferase
MLKKTLQQSDQQLFKILQLERQRQNTSICLIASENFTSSSVYELLGSCFQNKYSEGYPLKRYYGGNQYIDQMELLCQKRALEAYRLNQDWGVNVQALSGAPANLYTYAALLKPHERIMGLDLPHGGHLSHGYQTPTKKISFISSYFETLPYRLDTKTGLIDYDKMEELALLYRPKILIGGASAYARLIDYKRMREIADKAGALLMVDMAHLSGIVAAGCIPSPFEYADIVTTTTHKSLRGPRGAMIFFKKDDRGLEEKINFSVFPGHQGGPHNQTIAALATALLQAQTPEFKVYQEQVLENAKVF